jgi:hypothetical protein
MNRRSAILLAMAGLAWTAPLAYAEPTVYHAALFDVTTGPDGEVAGDTFVWHDGAIAFTNPVSNVSSWSGATDFTWAAHTGFKISDFTVVYDLPFSGGSYVVQGNETGVDFGPLQPGDTWFSSADFETSSGEGAHFVGTGEHGVLTHHVIGDQFNASFLLVAHGLAEFCIPSPDPFVCSAIISVPTTLGPLTISITPTIVAVPEPQTNALLAIGLAALVASVRRMRASGRHERHRAAGDALRSGLT